MNADPIPVLEAPASHGLRTPRPTIAPFGQPEVQFGLPGRPAAAVLSAANSTSSRAEPMCSIERDPRRKDHTICTAVAAEAVFTVRMRVTSAAYGPALVFKFRRIRTQNGRSVIHSRTRTRHMSQLRCKGAGPGLSP